ncbi:MAG: hypothetical protein A2X48_18050 [Lentisphaerae bacterium GWF2_49_21]|nr:MAG: hypothetical protein A2X48_18050 [Lentisphaerae bacterium GWF2_49_21]
MEEINTLADSEIICLVIKGDTELYSEIVRRYQSKIYGCAYAIMQNSHDASDVTQEVFVRFYRNIEQFDTRRPLSPYLLAIAVNCTRNLFRDRKMKFVENEEESKDIIEGISDSSPNPIEALSISEKSQRIRMMVHKLPVSIREICALFYLSEKSCSEVARILNISESSVKTGLHRARKKLLENYVKDWSRENAYGL